MEKSLTQSHLTGRSLRRLDLIRNQLKKCEPGMKREAVRVLVTGASGNIGYALVFMIAQGRMFGDIPVILHLFDLPFNNTALKGLAMELMDGAFGLLKGVVHTVDPAVAFKDVDYAVLCGAKPRSQGMERKDLLTANAKIFEEQGKLFDKYARKNVKVCVVGNPANTNALILSKNAPTINPKNFTALTRLDHNRAISQLSEKLSIDNEKLKNVIIWGNHSATQYPDVDYAYVENHCLDTYTKSNIPVKSFVGNDKWVQGDFIKTVQQRGAAIIQARKLSSAASAASSACDHMRDWVLGTAPGTWTSMAVMSKGEYGAPSDIVFSFPVTCINGEWKIVEGLKLSDFSKEKISLTGKELLEERQMALGN